MRLDLFPKDAGVYLMKDRQGKVLYVGKAKSLIKRIKQYYQGQDDRPLIPHLMKQVDSIDTIVVNSEREALVLESQLIKKHKPKYNLLLKDDKNFIRLRIDIRKKWPKIEIVRKIEDSKPNILYFGPFTSSYAARQTLQLIERLFPLRRCSDEEFKRRSRPCLLYQMHRCSAPCVEKISSPDYKALIEGAARFLKGEQREAINILWEQLQNYSARLEYEKAQETLVNIRHLEKITEKQHVDLNGYEECDAIALYRKADQVSLSILFFREGRLADKKNYFFSNILDDESDVLSTFLTQYYQSAPLPKTILLSHPTSFSLEEELNTKVIIPQRGTKKELIDLAQKNAKAYFDYKSEEEERFEKILFDTQEILKLQNFPRVITCFDNSHLAGSEAVAVAISFVDGKPDKKKYRTYKLKNTSLADDYGAMKEVISRHLKHALDKQELPDLLLIDGGKGQLSSSKEVLDDLNLTSVDIASLSKEEGKHDKGMRSEKIHLLDEKEPTLLSHNHPVLHFLQNIRDEAHRFAITFHKKRRSKEHRKSALDEIEGIGPVKKRTLIRRFGSPEKVFNASYDELKLAGLNDKEALRVLGYKHS